MRLPQATWAEIKHYLANPANLKNPAVGEVPTELEQSSYRSELSKEQLAYMLASIETDRAMANLALNDSATIQSPVNPIVDVIKQYLEDHLQADNAEVLANVTGATIPLILKAKMSK
jgi:hypothetical protein